MRITTDHAFHIGSQHLRSGLPCQDYAMSGKVSDGLYAIVSDGCSTGGRTDVGARIVTHTTALALEKTGASGGVSFDVDCSAHDWWVARNLGLSRSDLFATCLYIKALPSLPGVQARMLGDGVFAERRADGRLFMERVEWADNMPAYRAYHQDDFVAFNAAQAKNFFPTSTSQFHLRELGADSSSWESGSDLPTSILGKEWFSNSQDMADLIDVAIFSDGVAQVEGMDWRDVVAELMAFKSTEGDFVKRRMNRFLKDCLRHGKGPIDDISMAAIHIDHGVGNV